MSTPLFKTNRMMILAAAALLAVLPASASAQSAADIDKAVNAAYTKYKGLQEGKNADYIPALAKVDPNLFGIAVVTADGKAHTAGDVATEVSIQSISKVFTMARVMQDDGPDAIAKTIGVDATGMRFNSIVSVEQSYKMLGGPEMNTAVAFYCGTFVFGSFTFNLLVATIRRCELANPEVELQILGRVRKAFHFTFGFYLATTLLALVQPWAALALNVAVRLYLLRVRYRPAPAHGARRAKEERAAPAS